MFPFTAGGDVNPSRFVKQSTAADYTVLQATANDPVIGISSEAAKDAPIPNASGLAAVAGSPLRVYGSHENEPTKLLIGVGGCAAGDELISDANGKGVVRAATGTVIQNVGAIAMAAAAAGELVDVQPVRYPLRPALV